MLAKLVKKCSKLLCVHVSGHLIFHEDGNAQLLKNEGTAVDNMEAFHTLAGSTLLSGNAQTVPVSPAALLTTSTSPSSQISFPYKSSKTTSFQENSTAVASDSSKCLPGSYNYARPKSEAQIGINSDVTDDSDEDEVLFFHITPTNYFGLSMSIKMSILGCDC